MQVNSTTTCPGPELTQLQFERFRGLIEERAGIYYPDSRRDALRRALAARLTRLGVVEWDEYARLLACPSRGGDEFRELLRYITISETDFFRIPSQFEALRRVLAPAIVAQRPAGVISIWSAGCATGEEPYSIAITLADMGAALRGWRASILATDVSADALERARRGRYRERDLRGVPPGHLARHFRRHADDYEVGPELRRQVAFQEFNLAHSPYPRPAANGWDVIFCRNVTMYFRPETARQVIARFREVLRPGGFLVLSPIERLRSLSDELETIEAAGALIYVKPPLDRALADLRGSHRQEITPALTARGARPAGGRRRVALLPAVGRPTGSGEREVCARALADIAADRWERAEQGLAEFRCPPDAGDACLAAARPRAAVLLAWVRAVRGNCDKAAALCHDLLARDPLLAPAHYVLGLIASRAGDLDEAAEHFAKAIYADGGLVPAHYRLGVTHCARGDSPSARRAFGGALRALERAGGSWADFSEGVSPDHWRRVCEERLAGLSPGDV